MVLVCLGSRKHGVHDPHPPGLGGGLVCHVRESWHPHPRSDTRLHSQPVGHTVSANGVGEVDCQPMSVVPMSSVLECNLVVSSMS
jgi:hypothetical protein